MIKNEEPDYMKKDADFLDHQFEVNQPLLAGLSSERDKEWQQYMATHEGKTAAQLYDEGESTTNRFLVKPTSGTRSS